MAAERPVRRVSLASLVTVALFIAVLGIAGFFFGVKFYELILVAKSDPDGAFAVTPIVNYLLAGLGFLCMLGWAIANGMFHDIEQPKWTMLDNEERLDTSSAPSIPEDDAKGSI